MTPQDATRLAKRIARARAAGATDIGEAWAILDDLQMILQEYARATDAETMVAGLLGFDNPATRVMADALSNSVGSAYCCEDCAQQAQAESAPAHEATDDSAF